MIEIGRPDVEKNAKQWGAKYVGAWETLLPFVDGWCTATEHKHAHCWPVQYIQQFNHLCKYYLPHCTFNVHHATKLIISKSIRSIVEYHKLSSLLSPCTIIYVAYWQWQQLWALTGTLQKGKEDAYPQTLCQTEI